MISSIPKELLHAIVVYVFNGLDANILQVVKFRHHFKCHFSEFIKECFTIYISSNLHFLYASTELNKAMINVLEKYAPPLQHAQGDAAHFFVPNIRTAPGQRKLAQFDIGDSLCREELNLNERIQPLLSITKNVLEENNSTSQDENCIKMEIFGEEKAEYTDADNTQYHELFQGLSKLILFFKV